MSRVGKLSATCGFAVNTIWLRRRHTQTETTEDKKHHGMTDDKKKAERHFNWQAIKEAVERMKPELIAASEAAHKAKDADSDEDDPGYSDLKVPANIELVTKNYDRLTAAFSPNQ